MKIKHLLQTAVLMLFISTTSCKKSSTSTSTSVPKGKASVTFNYSGAESGSFSSTVSSSTCIKGALITISAPQVTAGSTVIPTVYLYIDPSISVGNHPQTDPVFSNGTTVSFSNGNLSGFNGWASGGGTATGFTLNITKNDATGIEGTFSGEMGTDENTTKITVTNGSFKGVY